MNGIAKAIPAIIESAPQIMSALGTAGAALGLGTAAVEQALPEEEEKKVPQEEIISDRPSRFSNLENRIANIMDSQEFSMFFPPQRRPSIDELSESEPASEYQTLIEKPSPFPPSGRPSGRPLAEITADNDRRQREAQQRVQQIREQREAEIRESLRRMSERAPQLQQVAQEVIEPPGEQREQGFLDFAYGLLLAAAAQPDEIYYKLKKIYQVYEQIRDLYYAHLEWKASTDLVKEADTIEELNLQQLPPQCKYEIQYVNGKYQSIMICNDRFGKREY